MGSSRVVIVVAMAAALLVSTAGVALAHGDTDVAHDLTSLEPGASATYSVDLHFHRLAGEVRAGGAVTVELRRAGATAPSFASGPSERVGLNHLIACCDDEQWAAHELVVTNTGSRSVLVHTAVNAIHDDLAVMVAGAEAGAHESVVVLGGLWAWVLWRIARRRSDPVPLRRSVGVGAAVVGFVATLTLGGTLRYEGAGAGNLVAALGDLPILPMNPVVSRASLLMGAAIFGWGYAGAKWARARPGADPVAWRAVGAGLIGLVVVTAVAIAAEYRAWVMPTAAAVAAALPIIVTLSLPRRLAERAPTPQAI